MSLSAIVADDVGGGRDVRSAQPSRCVCSHCKSLGEKKKVYLNLKNERSCFIRVCILCENTPNQEFGNYYFCEDTLHQCVKAFTQKLN